jgi:hypothetical protein
MAVYVFISGAVVAYIILRVEEDIVIRSTVIASIAVIITLGLVVSVVVDVAAIIVVVILRRLLRVCVLIGLFPLAKRVFAGFTL